MNGTRSFFRKTCVAAMLLLLTFSITSPSAVSADDLPPANPSVEENPPAPPLEIPVTCPEPEDEWVPWPIEGPETIRIYQEKTDSSAIKFEQKEIEEAEEIDTPKILTAKIRTINTALLVFLVANPSSYILYNSLVSGSAVEVR